MATYLEKAAVASDGSFVLRVREAIIEAAIAIQSESPETAGHAERVALALEVLRAPDESARRFAVGVSTNSNIGSGVSDPVTNDADGDSALAFVVASIWNAYGGVA